MNVQYVQDFTELYLPLIVSVPRGEEKKEGGKRDMAVIFFKVPRIVGP